MKIFIHSFEKNSFTVSAAEDSYDGDFSELDRLALSPAQLGLSEEDMLDPKKVLVGMYSVLTEHLKRETTEKLITNDVITNYKELVGKAHPVTNEDFYNVFEPGRQESLAAKMDFDDVLETFPPAIPRAVALMLDKNYQHFDFEKVRRDSDESIISFEITFQFGNDVDLMAEIKTFHADLYNLGLPCIQRIVSNEKTPNPDKDEFTDWLATDLNWESIIGPVVNYTWKPLTNGLMLNRQKLIIETERDENI